MTKSGKSANAAPVFFMVFTVSQFHSLFLKGTLSKRENILIYIYIFYYIFNNN